MFMAPFVYQNPTHYGKYNDTYLTVESSKYMHIPAHWYPCILTTPLHTIKPLNAVELSIWCSLPDKVSTMGAK